MNTNLSPSKRSYATDTPSKLGLKVSMFQIPEQIRAGLLQVAALSAMTGPRKSINTCILEAIEAYLSTPEDKKPEPCVPKLPLRHYTVRMDAALKHKLSMTAAAWQIRLGIPVPMNAIVNTAVVLYIQKIISGFKLPPA